VLAFEDAEVQAHLVSNGCDEAQAARFAYLANGNMQEALDWMKNEESDLEALFVQWFRLCFSRKGIEIQSWIEKIAVSGFGRENQKNMLRFGLQVLRDCIAYNASANEVVRFESTHFELPKLAGIINEVNAPLLIEHLEKAIYHIERNANPKILFLDLSIQMMRDLQRKM
jgi:DNA polymerase-3 subunit delta'